MRPRISSHKVWTLNDQNSQSNSRKESIMRRIYCAIAMLAMMSALVPAQTIKQTREKSGKAKSEAGFQIAAATVTGSGTTNFLPKWLGAPGSGVLGDSGVFEDKFGKVGIGTTTPTSPLTVKGLIEITMGGLKFPDGTVQSSAFTAVNHDTTLQGDGSAA